MVFWTRVKPALLANLLIALAPSCSSGQVLMLLINTSFVKITSLLKASKSAIDPSQFLRFLKQVLVKSGRPHFNIFEQQDAKEISARILDELWGNFILALDLVQVKIRVTIDFWFSHHSIDKKDTFTILQLPVANTVQPSLDLFLTPELHSGVNSFFCNYSSSL